MKVEAISHKTDDQGKDGENKVNSQLATINIIVTHQI